MIELRLGSKSLKCPRRGLMLVAPGANPEVNGTPDPNRPEGAKLSLSHPLQGDFGT